MNVEYIAAAQVYPRTCHIQRGNSGRSSVCVQTGRVVPFPGIAKYVKFHCNTIVNSVSSATISQSSSILPQSSWADTLERECYSVRRSVAQLEAEVSRKILDINRAGDKCARSFICPPISQTKACSIKD